MSTAVETLLEERQLLANEWSLERTRLLMGDPQSHLDCMWQDARFVVFSTHVDAATARRWLPPPFRLPEKPMATIFVADYPMTQLGFGYREAGVMLHATLRKKPCLHCAWMAVDDDTAMILGRELLGFPKKLANIELSINEKTAYASVQRRGKTVLKIEADAGEHDVTRRIFDYPIVNLRGIPSFAPGLLFSMHPDETCRHSDKREFRVSSEFSAVDPLQELQIPSRVSGHHVVADVANIKETMKRSIIPPVRVAGLVSPVWLWNAYPFRTW